MKWVNSIRDGPVSVRPLVRYVDEDQAVIEIHLHFPTPLPPVPSATAGPAIEAVVELKSAEGFHDEHRTPLRIQDQRSVIRLEIVRPQRWWPAGMGTQALYTMIVKLLSNNNLQAEYATTIGLTSVRRLTTENEVELLVNGQVCEIQSVVPVDLADERSLLPAAGDSLLVIRGHYGPDLLYDAADRAGILLIQCVPIDADGLPQLRVAEQVDRLAPHPSLAGWFVGHLGDLTDQVSQRLRSLDPGRAVFSDVPGLRLY